MILLSILTSVNSYADVTLLPGVSLIKKSQPAPYDGVLLSNDKAKSIYDDLHNCEKLREASISLLKSLALMQDNEIQYKQQITTLTTQNTALDNAVISANSDGFWRKAMYFGLGVLTSGLIVYAARK